MTHSGIECPECGKFSVVPKSSADNLYVCLGCKFKGNPNPPPSKKPEPKLSQVIFASAIAFLVVSVFSQLRPKPELTPNPASIQQSSR